MQTAPPAPDSACTVHFRQPPLSRPYQADLHVGVARLVQQKRPSCACPRIRSLPDRRPPYEQLTEIALRQRSVESDRQPAVAAGPPAAAPPAAVCVSETVPVSPDPLRPARKTRYRRRRRHARDSPAARSRAAGWETANVRCRLPDISGPAGSAHPSHARTHDLQSRSQLLFNLILGWRLVCSTWPFSTLPLNCLTSLRLAGLPSSPDTESNFRVYDHHWHWSTSRFLVRTLRRRPICKPGTRSGSLCPDGPPQAWAADWTNAGDAFHASSTPPVVPTLTNDMQFGTFSSDSTISTMHSQRVVCACSSRLANSPLKAKRATPYCEEGVILATGTVG